MTEQLIASIPLALALLVLFVALPLAWYVTRKTWRLAGADPEGEAVRVAAVVFLCLAIIVSVFCLTFLNNGMKTPALDTYQTQILTRSTLLVCAVIAHLTWLRWYRRKNGHGR